MGSKQLENAIKNLGVKRTIEFQGQVIHLACLLREEDRRPFQAEWYRGKQSTLIAVDDEANFYLQHSGGYIFRLKLHTSNMETIAKSEREFLGLIQW